MIPSESPIIERTSSLERRLFRPALFAFSLLAFAGARIYAADPPPELVADIGDVVHENLEEVYAGSNLFLASTLDGVAYFHYDDGIHGRELWRSDGTPEGSFILADLCPGVCGAPIGAPAVATLGDRVFFTATDGVHGIELWSTDGTTEATSMFADLVPGLRGSRASQLRAAGEHLFFTALFEEQVWIWVSDGTPAGTHRLESVVPGEIQLRLFDALAIGSTLIFENPSDGFRLWRTDGTEAGTFRLGSGVHFFGTSRLANPGAIVLGDHLLFVGSDTGDGYGSSLWATDGTSEGTRQLHEVFDPFGFVAGESVAYFLSQESVSQELWQTDGTAGGTLPIDLPAGLRVRSLSFPKAAIGDSLVFAGCDAFGCEPWIADGTSAARIRDLLPGAGSSLDEEYTSSFDLYKGFFAAFGGRAIFPANDGHHGVEIWSTDGTANGTKRLTGIAQGAESARFVRYSPGFPLARTGLGVLFTVLDPEGRHVLWRSDGTQAGTIRLTTLRGQTSAFSPARPTPWAFQNKPLEHCFTPLRDGLLFRGSNAAAGTEPWFTSARTSATSLVGDLNPDPLIAIDPACRAFDGGGLVASLVADSDTGLWSTSGEPGSSVLIASGTGVPIHSYSWASTGETLEFASGDYWTTDGTTLGTQAIEAGYEEWFAEVVPLGEASILGGNFLYSSDRQPGGLTRLTPEDSPNYPLRLTPFGSSILFFGYDSAGDELWRTQGTPQSTEIVRDIWPGSRSSLGGDGFDFDFPSITRIVALGEFALFAADDGIHGEELWRTDGTEAGTVRVADLFPGSYPSVPTELTRVGGYAYFVAETPGLGRELWRSDGTAEGTTLVADLVPGPGSSIPERLTAAGSELYFSAWTPERGREAWRVRDLGGGAFSVKALPEIAPGPLSSSPEVFREIGGAIYTAANGNVRGFELWRLREEDNVFSDGFEGTSTDLWEMEP